MENAIIPPPSHRMGLGSAASDSRDSSNAERPAGYLVAATAAFASVTGLSLWGLGVVGAFDGPSVVLLGAQIAGGVVVTVGFAGQAMASLWGDP